MNAIKSFLGLATKEPLILNDDDIYPTTLFDDTKSMRDMILHWTFHFNDVLDAEKLRLSLARLLEIGDWRKIGGRYRINTQNKAEFHVPKEFTAERPAFRYSHRVFDMDINEHPTGRKFPKAGGNPAFHPGSQIFKDLATTPGDPMNGWDLLEGDKPQMSLNIVSFNDATLVSLVCSHMLMDAGGLQALLHNWSLVLAGRESEVVPVLGAWRDVVYEVAKDPVGSQQEELNILSKRIVGWKMFIFIVRFLWELLWYGKPTYRTIFLPKATIDRLRREAQEEIAESQGPVEDEKLFISEGDVLSAWIARLVALSDSRHLPVSILNAVNLRFRFDSLKNATGVYIQNLALCIFAFISPSKIRGPLGPVALENRKYLTEQTTQPQIRACLRKFVEESKNGIDGMLFGEPNMLLIIITNWTKAYLTQAADFSAAVLKKGDSGVDRRNALGQMTQASVAPTKESFMSKNMMIIRGKDHEGNYWLEGAFLPKAWNKFEEEISRLSS
ncbi:hypothetical protein NW768_002381 [Fusarium equiseti]|uniref:Uncharacterized protein n=1 Tax=Fusarium equiseti TaxID=61235 RepID=A0ABQ8RNJ5_FUSEQ|nr:hypothetical protein NW768_002381 [Fusarium equiseti]